MRKKLWLVILILLGGAVSMLVFLHYHSAPTYTVNLTNQGFSPSELSISTGSRVIFKNTDTVAHWPASNTHPTHTIYPEFDPKQGIPAGETWSFTFKKAGTWRMHDHLLPQFSGVITVKGEATASERMQYALGKAWAGITKFFKHTPAATTESPVAADDERIFKDDAMLGAYLKTYGPKNTILALQKLETKFGSCHQPAHRAGHLGYQILKDKALIEYGPECQSGYYHGVIEAYFTEHGTEDLKTSLDTLCPQNQNDFFDHQCVHGIGHGLLAWTNYELPEALKACDLLPRRQDSCWTGVFMENLSAQIIKDPGLATTPISQNDVHVTKYLSNDPLYPCNAVAAQYQDSCYFLQTSRMLQIFGQDFSKIAEACDQAPAIHQSSCFASMGRDVGGRLTTDIPPQIQACQKVKQKEYQIQCLNGAVQNSFWDPSGQNAARTFCQLVTDPEEKQSCYGTVFNRARQLITAPAQLEAFCNATEANYQQPCRDQLLTPASL